MANGRERAVVTFDTAIASGPAPDGNLGQVLGTLSAELFERLVQRIYRRISAVTPGISERAVRRAVRSCPNAVAIGSKLIQRASADSHTAIRLIVDDEVRWIRLRREPSSSDVR
jgi:hypothetical protein